MSAIYFHSQNGEEARLYGSERAYMSKTCDSLLFQSLGLEEGGRIVEDHWVANLFPPDHYIRTFSKGGMVHWLKIALSTEYDLPIKCVDGTQTTALSLAINTALRVGNDQIKLMARLHSQCEIHAWVDGPNRKWLADIIDLGRKTHLFRANQGWEDVSALLRKREDSPVVASYSVCDGFPNQTIAKLGGCVLDEDDEEDTAWYDLSPEEQWNFGIAGLKAYDSNYTYGLELRPDTWDDYIVELGVSGYDLSAWNDVKENCNV